MVLILSIVGHAGVKEPKICCPLADPRLRLASQHIIARHYTTVMGCAMHASI